MTDTELKQQLIAILKSIAPELEEDLLRTDRSLRSQVDLDSMDWLKFLVAVHEKTAVDIPESEYARLVTLDDIAAHVIRARK